MLFVAGRVNDLLVPSSVTRAVFVTQLTGAVSVPACSNAKLVVSTDGQEPLHPCRSEAPKAQKESAGMHGPCMRTPSRPRS